MADLSLDVFRPRIRRERKRITILEGAVEARERARKSPRRILAFRLLSWCSNLRCSRSILVIGMKSAKNALLQALIAPMPGVIWSDKVIKVEPVDTS